MLIEKDKGHVELSVSLAETWPVSAGRQRWITGRILGMPASVHSPVCLSVGTQQWQRACVCFLMMIKSF